MLLRPLSLDWTILVNDMGGYEKEGEGEVGDEADGPGSVCHGGRWRPEATAPCLHPFWLIVRIG